MIHLLDVNVLIALADPGHVQHAAATRFFPKIQATGWATCPIVENGFIRIIGHSRYPNGPGSAELARQLLANYLAAPGHQFWPDDLSLADSRRFPRLPASAALTDLYLLGLAAKNSSRLATFDSSMDPTLIPNGASAYFLIPAS